MITLTFNINQQKLKRTSKNILVNKSKNVISCNFEFTDTTNWEGIEKFASFTNDKEDTYLCSLGKDMTCECVIPEEAMTGNYMKIGVFGGDRITTNNLLLPLINSGFTKHIKQSTGESDFFHDLYKKINVKYDDLVLEENKLYCYSGDECLKIINFDDLILNTYPTKDYVESELNKKYDDFTYENGSLLCFINGELRKKIPITGIEEFYTRKEIDEQFNEVNNRLDEFIIDGEVIETDNSLLLNFN